MSINVTIHGNPVTVKKGRMVALDADKEFGLRRRIRLQQVRQQSKEIAEDVRNRVRREKNKQLNKIEKEEEKKLQDRKDRQLAALNKQYDKCVEVFGEAYRNADSLPNEDEVINKLTEHARNKAEIRGKIATDAQRERIEKEKAATRKPIEDKKIVRTVEDIRAKLISNIPKRIATKDLKQIHRRPKSNLKINGKRAVVIDDSFSDDPEMEYESEFGNLSVLGEVNSLMLDSEGNSIQSDESASSVKENELLLKSERGTSGKQLLTDISSSKHVLHESKHTLPKTVTGTVKGSTNAETQRSQPSYDSHQRNYDSHLNIYNNQLPASKLIEKQFNKDTRALRKDSRTCENEECEDEPCTEIFLRDVRYKNAEYEEMFNKSDDSNTKKISPPISPLCNLRSRSGSDIGPGRSKGYVDNDESMQDIVKQMKQRLKHLKQYEDADIRDRLNDEEEMKEKGKTPVRIQVTSQRKTPEKCFEKITSKLDKKKVQKKGKKNSRDKSISPKNKPYLIRKIIRSTNDAIPSNAGSSESKMLNVHDYECSKPTKTLSKGAKPKVKSKSRFGMTCPCPPAPCVCQDINAELDLSPAGQHDEICDPCFGPSGPYIQETDRKKFQQKDSVLPYVPTTIVHPETDESPECHTTRYYDHFNRFGGNVAQPTVVQKISTDSIQVVEPSEGEKRLKEAQELHKKRIEEAKQRGLKALEKNKIQKEYKKLLKELPVLQRQERLAAMATHNPTIHMDDERYLEMERKKQNRLENQFENYQNRSNAYNIPLITLKSVRKSPPKSEKGPFKAVDGTEGVLNVGQWKNIESSCSCSPQLTAERTPDSISDTPPELACPCEDKSKEQELADLLKRVNKQREILLHEAANLPSLSTLKDVLNEQEILKLLSKDPANYQQCKVLVETGTSPIQTVSTAKPSRDTISKSSSTTGSSDTSKDPPKKIKRKTSKKIKTQIKEMQTQTTPVSKTSIKQHKEEGTQTGTVYSNVVDSSCQCFLKLSDTNDSENVPETSSSDPDKLCEIIIKAIQDANVHIEKRQIVSKGKPDKANLVIKVKDQRQPESRTCVADMSASTSYMSPPVEIDPKRENVPDIARPIIRPSNKDLLQAQKQQTNLNNMVTIENGSKELNPRLLKYIKRLLDMSRQSIDELTVSSVSDVSTPQDSVLQVTSNVAKEKLQNVMDHFNLNVDDIKKYCLSSSSISTSDVSSDNVLRQHSSSPKTTQVSSKRYDKDTQNTCACQTTQVSPKKYDKDTQKTCTCKTTQVSPKRYDKDTQKTCACKTQGSPSKTSQISCRTIKYESTTDKETSDGEIPDGMVSSQRRYYSKTIIRETEDPNRFTMASSSEKETFTHASESTSTSQLKEKVPSEPSFQKVVQETGSPIPVEQRYITLSPTLQSLHQKSFVYTRQETMTPKSPIKTSEVIVRKSPSPRGISPSATGPKSTSPVRESLQYMSARPTSPRTTSPKHTVPRTTSPKLTSPRSVSRKGHSPKRNSSSELPQSSSSNQVPCSCPDPPCPCPRPKTFVTIKKSEVTSSEPDSSVWFQQDHFLKFVRESLGMTEQEFSELGLQEMFARHMNLTEYCQDRINSLMNLIQKVREDKKLIYSPSPVDNSMTLTSYLELPQSKSDAVERKSKLETRDKSVQPSAGEETPVESGSSPSQGTIDDYLLGIDANGLPRVQEMLRQEFIRLTREDRTQEYEVKVTHDEGKTSSKESSDTFVPMLQGIPKYNGQESAGYMHEIFQRMKPRPPPSLLRANMRGQTDAVPHELSTIVEAETVASSRNTSVIRPASPEEREPSRDVSPCQIDYKKTVTSYMSPRNNQSDSGEYITITPERTGNDSSRSVKESPTKSPKQNTSSSSYRDEHHVKSMSKSTVSGIRPLSDTTSESPDELENMLHKFNLEWAVSLVKKTEQALALSSSSSSSDIQIVKRDNPDVSLKENYRQLYKRLKNSSGSDSDKSQLFIDLSHHFKELQDLSEILAPPESRNKTQQQRTSTPVQVSKSSDSKDYSKESLFKVESELSSVRNSSDNLTDNLYLSIPNVTLNTTRCSLNKCKKNP